MLFNIATGAPESCDENTPTSLRIGPEMVEIWTMAPLGVKKMLFPPFGTGSNWPQPLSTESLCLDIWHGPTLEVVFLPASAKFSGR